MKFLRANMLFNLSIFTGDMPQVIFKAHSLQSNIVIKGSGSKLKILDRVPQSYLNNDQS